ncbi:thermonuclease family protein [bacterium]|nr:thermonuclease family protein [bacterium]
MVQVPAPSQEPAPVEAPAVEEKPVEVEVEETAPPAKTPSLVMEKIDTDGDGIPDTFIIKGEPGKKPVSLAKAKTKKPKHLIEEKPDNLIKATCIKVSDGDTIKVRLDDDSVENVRLYGVDCPEKQQPFGKSATQFTKSMVLGKTVNISPVTTDDYGRTIAWVYVGEKCLDKELLKAGLAWHYKEYSEEEELAILEEEARAKKIGLWQEPNPTPPWEWRHSR